MIITWEKVVKNLIITTSLLATISLPVFAETAFVKSLDLVQYRTDVKTLASDAFGGRAPLSEGETLTLDYLVTAFKDMGLKPGFGDSYLQAVPLAQISADQNMQLDIGGLKFANGSEFTARTQRIADTVSLNKSDVVFVGYGINAPEYGWNDYQGLDVKGKTVIVLVNDPGFATQDPTIFKGNAMTYYGRWTYKYEEAARQGAEAVFIVHETAPAAYGWGVVQNSNIGTKFTLVDANNNQGQVGVMGWVQHETAQKIFAKAGLDFDTLKQQAAKPNFKAIPLKLSAQLTLNNKIERAESHNVAALLPGKTRPDEVVMMHAHWDHLGTVIEDGKSEILNGAVDNASGVAGVLALARYFKQQASTAALDRSVLFSAFTAEETGLIGAQHFAQHPSVPTKNIVAFLNIDGMNVNKGVDYILRYGEGVSELEQYLDKAAKVQDRSVKADPRPQNGLMFRSDHFALAQQGVPGLLFMSLGDTDPDYIAHKYHQGADDYDPNWTLEGVSQDLDLIASMITTLANGSDWPHWLESSDFKAKREQDGRK
ncbi:MULTISPECIES: M28 family metallopeptidase [unclassified Shewanella]|uniref:M28 family metallopeptidase n=1 Tax=unclassified Shewanella TaxID=196818 RepID=UPI0021D822AC|nr:MULTISPECIES: M28 family metallopeptidase [unclassified Shewanella]MCU8003442.1 M28 family metallopeptidase [Shewanella sp. SM96]MCU8059271.1 M28 family metallopeptidase [Shewanella sp. SM55]MCU8087812.1 M28 family metallopeptidase [Shewanella sp. SM21]